MIDVKGSGEAKENAMLTATSFSMTGLVVVSDGPGSHIHGGTNRPLQAREWQSDCH